MTKLPVIVLGILLVVLGIRTYINKVYFYRDPPRKPDDISAVTAPCDGKVVYIEKIKNGKVVSRKLGEPVPVSEITKADFGNTDGWLIGIYMTPLDVHFNYAPVSGTITDIVRTKAKVNLPMVDIWEYIQLTYLRKAVDVFSAKYRLNNERMTLFIEGDQLSVAMVEIADKFVNKITAFVEKGTKVNMGDKVSFIERGSQVDLVLFTPEIEFLVKVGDQVYGGKTPIAKVM